MKKIFRPLTTIRQKLALKAAMMGLATLFSLLTLIASAQASISSVEPFSSSAVATTGTSLTISATIIATESETTSVQLITSPSGITVTDPATGQYSGVSVSTSPVTKTFTISAGTANTYTYQVQAGSVSSSEDTISYVDPSTLTLSASPTSKSASSGDTFTLSITVTNPTTDTTSSAYTLNLPSGYSASGDATSGTITLASDSSTTLSWTVVVGSSSGTITFDSGSTTAAVSVPVTVPSAGGTTTVSAAAGGSSGGQVATALKLTKTFTSIIPEITKAITAVDLEQTDTGLTEILISVRNRVTEVEISIERLTSLPASVPSPLTTVYRIIDIGQKNLAEANLTSPKMKFKVAKSWLTNNSIDEKTIALYRLVGSTWNKLSTAKIDEDTSNVYFEATTPGFSYFVIGGEKLATAATTTTVPPATTTTTLPAAQPGAAEKKQDWIPYAVIGALIAVAAVIFVLVKKKIIKLPKLPKKPSPYP